MKVYKLVVFMPFGSVLCAQRKNCERSEEKSKQLPADGIKYALN